MRTGSGDAHDGRLYDAFISYNHEADHRLATELEGLLEQLAKPLFARRAMNVFRDATSLSLAPHLWTTIEKALVASQHLVYLGSPRAAESPWVGRELEYWLDNREIETLLIVLTDGNLVWDDARGDFDWNATDALPKSLAGRFGGEPLYLDLRWFRTAADSPGTANRLRESAVRLVAAIRVREVSDIYGEDLRQHRRLIRIRNAAIGVLLILTVVLAGALLVVWRQQAEVLASNATAERQRRIAEQQRAEAISARQIAETQRNIAVEQRREAEEAREVAERERARADSARAVAEKQTQFVTATLSERLSMDRVAKDGYFKIMEVFPRTGEARLTPEMMRALDGLVRLLSAYGAGKVRISGHVEPPGGNPEYALALGERQAARVSDYLIQKGIDARRIAVISFGDAVPLLPTDYPDPAINEIARRINGRSVVAVELASLTSKPPGTPSKPVRPPKPKPLGTGADGLKRSK